MKIIVGLGNPGEKFKNTPHNLGFRVADEFQEKNNLSDFKLSKKTKTEISEGVFNNEKIILAKPRTFMNDSGKAVKILTTKYKRQNTDLIVVHDDIDLPLGKIKIVKNRGAAGHKGVQSIINAIGSKDFIRFRIGIKPATRYKIQNTNTEKFVLQKFHKEEEKTVKNVVRKTTEAIEIYLKEGVEKAMNEFNKKREPR